MDHEAYITRQPYYGPFSQTASALYDDLHGRLPRGLYGMAFVDYCRGEVPLRLRLKRFGDKSNGRKDIRRSWGYGSNLTRAEMLPDRWLHAVPQVRPQLIHKSCATFSLKYAIIKNNCGAARRSDQVNVR